MLTTFKGQIWDFFIIIYCTIQPSSSTVMCNGKYCNWHHTSEQAPSSSPHHHGMVAVISRVESACSVVGRCAGDQLQFVSSSSLTHRPHQPRRLTVGNQVIIRTTMDQRAAEQTSCIIIRLQHHPFLASRWRNINGINIAKMSVSTVITVNSWKFVVITTKLMFKQSQKRDIRPLAY